MAGNAGMGAPLGNKNAVRAKRWRDAILRALARRSNDTIDAGLDAVADKLVTLMYEGDAWAIDHAADRIDGKATVTIAGDEDNPVIVREIVIRAVDPSDRSPEKGC